MIVINLFGEPGSGKTTAMHGMIYKLRLLGYHCEMANEWIKDSVWDGSKYPFSDQIYVFSHQLKKLRQLRNKGIDFVVTDSPLCLSVVYGVESKLFEELVIQEFNTFTNVSYYLNRITPYDPIGRRHSSKSASYVGKIILDSLKIHNIPYSIHNSSEDGINAMVSEVVQLVH